MPDTSNFKLIQGPRTGHKGMLVGRAGGVADGGKTGQMTLEAGDVIVKRLLTQVATGQRS